MVAARSCGGSLIVLIPKKIREKLNVKEGTEFIVYVNSQNKRIVYEIKREGAVS